MSSETENTYNSFYTSIFSFFYCVQGVHNGIWTAVIPVYIFLVLGYVDLPTLLMIGAIASLPWSVKFFIGLINDKYGSEKYGRRFPFIAIFGCFGGIFWIIMGIGLPTNSSIFIYLLIYGLLINIGLAVADTAIDGLMLDVTPKDKLGIVQALTFGIALVGMILGGFVLAIIFTSLNAIPLLFVIQGICMISVCLLPYFIQESPVPKEIHMWRDIKEIFGKRKNWKVFLYCIFDHIPYAIVNIVYLFVVLISIGVISVNDAQLSIQSGNATDYYTFSFLFNAALGIGVLIGLMISGKVSDKNRRFSVFIAHLIYVPFCLICIFFVGFYLAIVGHLILGVGQAWITISGQSVRADLSKEEYPELQSTYFALLISFNNIGISIGTLMLAYLFIGLGLVITNFVMMVFWIWLFMADFQMLSFLFLMMIPKEKYEFKHNLDE